MHQRTKHIEIDIHTIRDKILEKELKLQRVNTKLNVADILTKLVVGNLYQALPTQLRLVKTC